MATKSSPLVWNDEREVHLLREVLVSQPHQFKEKTRERGEKWQQISNNLNKSDLFQNKLSARSVREKTNGLVSRFRSTQRAELAATGINPEQSETDVLLEEICLQIDEFARQIAENNTKAKDAERDKIQGEEIRKKAMETQCQTIKRKTGNQEDDDDDNNKKKKSRSSGSDTVSFLREKAHIESKFKEQELDLQKKRLELDAAKIQSDQNNFNNMLLLMSNQMEQNQQLTMSMLERLKGPK
eukprot:TCONS_00022703-protein